MSTKSIREILNFVLYFAGVHNIANSSTFSEILDPCKNDVIEFLKEGIAVESANNVKIDEIFYSDFLDALFNYYAKELKSNYQQITQLLQEKFEQYYKFLIEISTQKNSNGIYIM